MRAISGLVAVLLLSACAATPQASSPQGSIQGANPASLNCLQNQGRLETVHTPQGAVTYCHLPGGKRCEEWDMFRGNCPTRTVNVKMKKFGF